MNKTLLIGIILLAVVISGCDYESTDYTKGNLDGDTNTNTILEETSLEIINHELKSETTYSIKTWFVEGTAKNTGTTTIEMATIKVRFFDEDGTLIENGFDVVSDLDPDMTFKFKVSFMGDIMAEDKPADYDIAIEGLDY
ncbi:MAG: FxLYD domain-containing protein [Candidatus Woesearchaeota archaeon]